MAYAVARLGQKLQVKNVATTIDATHLVTVTFDAESHVGFTSREQDFVDRIEEIWALFHEPALED